MHEWISVLSPTTSLPRLFVHELPGLFFLIWLNMSMCHHGYLFCRETQKCKCLRTQAAVAEQPTAQIVQVVCCSIHPHCASWILVSALNWTHTLNAFLLFFFSLLPFLLPLPSVWRSQVKAGRKRRRKDGKGDNMESEIVGISDKIDLQKLVDK